MGLREDSSCSPWISSSDWVCGALCSLGGDLDPWDSFFSWTGYGSGSHDYLLVVDRIAPGWGNWHTLRVTISVLFTSFFFIDFFPYQILVEVLCKVLWISLIFNSGLLFSLMGTWICFTHILSFNSFYFCFFPKPSLLYCDLCFLVWWWKFFTIPSLLLKMVKFSANKMVD